jgi:putative glutamine amidotransferase
MRRAGGKAVRLRPGDAVSLDELDGLVIGGGDDIGAELYGGQVAPNVRFDPDRDAFEISLLKKAFRTSLPILGVCRGAQIVNVALGGTLHGDIYTVFAEAKRLRTVLPRKNVWIDLESRLGQILLCNPCRVNALHHQAVDRVGRGLRVVGRDESGIVQAIEGMDARFLIGVQWHPEFLVHLRAQQRLFTALVACARECRVPEFAA